MLVQYKSGSPMGEGDNDCLRPLSGSTLACPQNDITPLLSAPSFSMDVKKGRADNQKLDGSNVRALLPYKGDRHQRGSFCTLFFSVDDYFST